MISYSHPATKQDLWVLDHSEYSGTFLELGAYDGIKHSNTLLLEHMGWKGSLIEGHKPFADKCRENRPQCEVINEFIGGRYTDGIVLVGGQYTGLRQEMPKDFRKEHEIRGSQQYESSVVPLHEAFGVAPVDYLSLDTEGNELSILSRWFQEGGSCRLLTVEFRYDTLLLDQITELCDQYGMSLTELRGFDACFISRSWKR